MKLLRALKHFWQSVPARATGSYLPISSDNVVRLRHDAPTVPRSDTLKLWPDLVDLGPRMFVDDPPQAPSPIPDDLPIG